MLFSFKDIVLKLNLKKHYESEPEESKTLYISIDVELSDKIILAKKLEDTFNYADYEIELLKIFKSKNFELIEEVACLIFDFTERYSKNIISCNLSIAKKGILENAKEVSMNVYKKFND